ncbi:MAG: serine/threonine-protein kinase [Kofleriaceae bacterium]
MILAGRYELERRLGGGGMAEVFLARVVGKEGFTRRVAIKRVLAHLATDEAFAKMFVAEAQMCALLVHPNIVSVLDFDRDEEGRPFLVIELVDGPSLAELADGGALPVGAALHLAAELLRGLAYAHDLPGDGDVRGVVHRDISPHNVLLSWEGAVKVSDFGIAKARAASGVTASELLKGKPAYMSPEQANGEPLDGRSDLFAVGVVLWEMLVGRSLFAGHTTQETLARVLFAPVPSPRSIRPELPADVDAVVMKLLAREKQDRYADAGAAIAALVACEDHPRDGREQLVALLADRFAGDAPQRRRLLADVPTVRTRGRGEYAPTLPAPRDARRRSAVMFAIGGFALASAAVAITLLATRQPRTPRIASDDERRVADEIPSVDAIPDGLGRATTPETKLLARRAEWMKAHGEGIGAFPPPDETAVELLANFEQARAEAQRLFGNRGEVAHLGVVGIGASGRFDATRSGHGMTLRFRFRPPTDDGFHCLEVSSNHAATPRFRIMLIKNAADCRDAAWNRPGVPRCSGLELYKRAIALGYAEQMGPLTAGLRAGAWRLYASVDSRVTFNQWTPNDCR